MKLKLSLPIGLSFASIVASPSCDNNSDKSSPDELPNVVLIYVDDMGYGDIALTGVYGYKTPNLDQMAAEGMFFTHFYAPQAVEVPGENRREPGIFLQTGGH